MADSPLRQQFRQLQALLDQDPAELARGLDYPTSWESGVTHPFLPVHFLCRDDGVAEMTSGPDTSVTVDGNQRQVTLQGGQVALSAQDLHLHAPPGGLWFGYQRFDPLGWWTEEELWGDPTRSTWNGPLVLNGIESLFRLETELFVGGTPQAGQYNVRLADLLHPQPLLGPNEWLRIMYAKLRDLAEELDL
jgi:hypothetical protein